MIFTDNILYHKELPSQGKLMALDVGTKRIGIATSDELRLLTTPKAILTRKSNFDDFTKIKDFALENSVKAIIIGFPTHMDGKPVQMTEFVENFAKNFDDFLNNNSSIKQLPIFLFDERLSSFEAKEFAREIKSRKKQKHYDDIAASVILKDFIAFVQNSIEI